MKKISFLLGIIVVLAACNLSSCGNKSGDSPVDQYVSVLEEATKKAEQISSMSELMNVQAVISPEEANEIIRNNADYELTEGDKDKLKKSFDKLLKVAYEKTAEYGGLPEDVKKATKSQVDLLIEAANNVIDKAQTMSDLNNIR